MNSKILGLALVGVGAVAAAGTGAYLASRQAPVSQVALESVGESPETVAGESVSETEGVLAPVTEVAGPKASAPSAQPKPPTQPSSRPRAATVPSGRPAQMSRSDAAGQPAAESRRVPAGADRRGENVPDQPAVAGLPDLTTPELPVDETTAPTTRTEAPTFPPSPEFEDLVVPAEAVVGLRVEGDVSSETARVEDRVEAVVTRDVRAGGRVAIPAGSRAEGSVVLVERGGKFKERARIGVRFHTLVLADGARMAMQSEPVYREGASASNESAAKIGGAAVGGAILGAIVGGGRGAAVGGSIGALGGTAAVMAGGRNAAVLAAGSSVTVRLAAPVTVTVEK